MEARPTATAAPARRAPGRDGRALHPGDVASQTRVAMENVRAVLGQLGATIEDVVKKNSYICAIGVGVDALWCPGS